MEQHQQPTCWNEEGAKQENDEHHHGDWTVAYSGLLGGTDWKCSQSGENYVFIYFSFILGHPLKLVDKSVTLENRPREKLAVR